MSNSEEHPIRKQESAHGATPGQYLHQLRKDKNLSVEVVAKATKISINNIRAIEEETYEKLPAYTFIRGLVTLYGDYLGVNGSKIAAEFLAKREETCPATAQQEWPTKKLPSSSLSPRKLAEPAHISSATIALVLLAIIVLSFTGFCLYTSWNPFAFLSQQTENMQTSMQGVFNGDTDQGTDATTTLPADRQQKQSRPSDRTAEKPADRIGQNSRAEVTGQQFSYTVSAVFLEDSKVVIRIDDRDAVRETFKKGERADWKAVHSLEIVFDKPEAATLRLNDSPWAFPASKNNQPPVLLLPDDFLDQ